MTAIAVGAAVLAAGGLTVRDGLTVGGRPLSALEPAPPAGLSRLMTDQLAALLTIAIVVGLAYLAATITRAALDDRWLRRLGPSGGELDPRDARLDEEQSEELRGLARAVHALSNKVGEHAGTIEQLKQADEALADAIRQVSLLADDRVEAPTDRYPAGTDEEAGR